MSTADVYNSNVQYSSVVLCFFFFSSRRRHTRFDCDWSSDVCSSDLTVRDFPSLEVYKYTMDEKGNVTTTLVLDKRESGNFLDLHKPEKPVKADPQRSEEHTSELQSQSNIVCRLLLEKKYAPHRPEHT